jgi:hypothetical protein
MASFNNKVFRQSYFYTLAKPPRHFVPPLHKRGTFALCTLVFALFIGAADAALTMQSKLDRKTGIDTSSTGQYAVYATDSAGGLKLTGANLSAVAKSGDYDDLSGKPTIPAAPGAITATQINTGTSTAAQTISANVANVGIAPFAVLSGSSTYTATIPGFVLENGARALVYTNQFIACNNSDYTLNINSTGAKQFYCAQLNVSLSSSNGALFQVVYVSSLGKYVVSGYQPTADDAGDSIRSGTYAEHTISPVTLKRGMMTFIGGIWTTSGTSSAYTITPPTSPNEKTFYNNTTLYVGQKIVLKIHVTNAANATLKINSQTAKPIFYNGAAITAGKLQANGVYKFVYDGTNYNVVASPTADVIPVPTAVCGNLADKCALGYTDDDFVWDSIKR